MGLKPTRDLVPSTGVVPACRSLACVSVFALEVADAVAVLGLIAGPDGLDPFARVGRQADLAEPLRIGVPRPQDLEWLGGGDGYEAVWAGWLASAAACLPVPVDMTPFLATAELLYAGPWLAERVAAVGDFIRGRPDAIWPVTQRIGGEPELLFLVLSQVLHAQVAVLLQPVLMSLYSERSHQA